MNEVALGKKIVLDHYQFHSDMVPQDVSYLEDLLPRRVGSSENKKNSAF